MKQKTIRLIVDLREAKEVEKLRQRVEELEEELKKAKRRAQTCEFDLVCQQRINLQFQDYCRDQGWKIPPRLCTLWRSSYRPGED